MSDLKELDGVTVQFYIHESSIDRVVKKMESFTRLVEKLSEEDACKGMTGLTISAKIG